MQKLSTVLLVLLAFILSTVSCKKEPEPKPIDDDPLIGIECPGYPLVYDADSNAYKTVLIGEQCWMRSNLNVGIYVPSTYSGNPHEDVSQNDTIEKYCFKNDTAFCRIFGGLYGWGEMMQYTIQEGTQGICPEGWRIPSDQDWKTLEITLGLSPTMVDSTGFRGFYQGQKLVKNGESKFDALFGGFRYMNGQFSHENYYASFWSSSLRNDSTAWYRGVNSGNPQIHRDSFGLQRGFAVRCIKN